MKRKKQRDAQSERQLENSDKELKASILEINASLHEDEEVDNEEFKQIHNAKGRLPDSNANIAVRIPQNYDPGNFPSAKVLYTFNARNEAELSIKEGDIVTIIEKRTGWNGGELNGKFGLFPANYAVQIRKKISLALDKVQPKILEIQQQLDLSRKLGENGTTEEKQPAVIVTEEAPIAIDGNSEFETF